MPLRTAVLIFAAVGGVGVTAAEGTPWTLQQCVDYALEHNLELRQKELVSRQSQVDMQEARDALFPSLSFATNQSLSWRPWSNSYVSITDGSMSSTNSTVNYNGTYGLQAQWTAWDGGVNRKRYQRSKMALEQADIDVETTGLSIQEQIIQAYVQILYQAQAVEVNKTILGSTRILLERAKEMHAVGSMSRADLAQMEAQVSQEEYNVTNAETQLAQFKLQLKTILELTGPDDIEVAIPVIDDDKVMTLPPTAEEVYVFAEAARPEIRSGQLGVKLADMDIDIARRGYYPSLGVSAGINTNAVSGVDRNWGRQIQTNLSNSIGVTLSVPIFDNGKNASAMKRARLSRETAQTSLDQMRQQLYNDIESYRLNTVNAQRQYASALKNAESMRESYTLVSEQFTVGLKDIVDLTTGKNNLIQAEQQLLQSKYTAVLNRAILDFYNGMKLSI